MVSAWRRCLRRDFMVLDERRGGGWSTYGVGKCYSYLLPILASLRSSSRCTGLKHPKPTVLGPAAIIVVLRV